MRLVLSGVLFLTATFTLPAQAPGKWPPDSLINVKIFPKNTPVMDVVGQMRNFAGGLGVRCQFCHVGEEGKPLATFDFASDQKRTKKVAREMMRMVQDINRRLDTLPERKTDGLQVACITCHRGVSRPVPLFTIMVDAATTSGADSAIRAYRALRQRYYGRDAYDFGESSLNIAAFRLGRAGKYDEAFKLLELNEELFPSSSGMYVFRGNVSLMRGDTAGAAAAYREAIRRDTSNAEAKGRLRDIGRNP
ncbi:MAG TPA: c-type cytochrome [Gemmatimonadaceae bacterium]|nr:c-type cytochrome [Gemmatimonadaceae bacterium]